MSLIFVKHTVVRIVGTPCLRKTTLWGILLVRDGNHTCHININTFKITFLGSSLFKQTTFPEELKSIYFDEKHGYLIHYNMFSGCVYHENFPQFVSNYQTVKNCVGDLLKVTIY